MTRAQPLRGASARAWRPARTLAVACASLGILGGKAYAVVGPDLAEGEAAYVAVKPRRGKALHEAQRRAAYQALEKLEERLGQPLIYFWTPYPPVARSGT